MRGFVIVDGGGRCNNLDFDIIMFFFIGGWNMSKLVVCYLGWCDNKIYNVKLFVGCEMFE